MERRPQHMDGAKLRILFFIYFIYFFILDIFDISFLFFYLFLVHKVYKFFSSTKYERRARPQPQAGVKFPNIYLNLFIYFQSTLCVHILLVVQYLSVDTKWKSEVEAIRPELHYSFILLYFIFMWISSTPDSLFYLAKAMAVALQLCAMSQIRDQRSPRYELDQSPHQYKI